MHKIMLLFSGIVNPAQTFNGRKNILESKEYFPGCTQNYKFSMSQYM